MMHIYKARDEDAKIEWEKIRVLSYFSVTAQQGTKNLKKPKDLFVFKWEEEKPQGEKIQSQEEALEKVQKIRINTQK